MFIYEKKNGNLACTGYSAQNGSSAMCHHLFYGPLRRLKGKKEQTKLSFPQLQPNVLILLKTR